MCVYVYTCQYVGVNRIIYCCVTAYSVYLWVRMAVSSSFDDSSLSSDPYSIQDQDSSIKKHNIISMFDVVHNIIIISTIITLNSHVLDHLICM